MTATNLSIKVELDITEAEEKLKRLRNVIDDIKAKADALGIGTKFGIKAETSELADGTNLIPKYFD